MSTVSTQCLLPKGLVITKRMKRFIVFALFFGLFLFSMSIFYQVRAHSRHSSYGSDPSVYRLAEEMKELKKNQDVSRKLIERLYANQQEIVVDQRELREVKEGLTNELSRIENFAVRTYEAYRNVQNQLQQHEQAINSALKTKTKTQGRGGSQDNDFTLIQLQNVKKELEGFRSVLQGFEAKIENSNRRANEGMRELKNWVGQNVVDKNEVNAVLQNHHNAQIQLINEFNGLKGQVNQVSQNDLKRGAEITQITRLLNGFREHGLEALQKLNERSTNSERRLNVIERTKMGQPSAGKQGSDNSQLAVDFKNFKEYTMEALQELRSYNNKNTKRINHLQTKENENSQVSLGDMVSQEVEKFLSNLGEGQLLEKLLAETNISMKELNTFVNIVKMLGEGDINGVMRVLNHLTGGNLMEQLMSAKEGLLRDFKPVIELVNGLSKGELGLKDLVKYTSLFSDLMGGEGQKETPKDSNKVGNYRQQKPQKKKEFAFEDLLSLFD